MAALNADIALARVLAAVPSPAVAEVPCDEALGLTLADDLIATADLPPFDRAMMDGYAVCLSDAGAAVAVLDEIAAGDGRARAPLAVGTAHPIMTGAPVPPGAEAVVPQEQVVRDGGYVRLPTRLVAGANIVRRGAECAAGTVWARAGSVVTPMTIAAAIAVGCDRLPVYPRPRVVVVATGNELSDEPSAPGAIRDSNGPMLVALLAEAGLTAQRYRLADDADALAHTLDNLAAFDAIILTGGVSTGTHDMVPGVLARLGAEVVVRGVAQKPGKPLLVARRGRQLLFALPGNPLAAHLCACRYALPALRRLAGLPHVPITVQAILAAPTPANGDRLWFLPALVASGSVTPLPPVSSADLVTPHRANAYLRLEPGAAPLPSGTPIACTRFGADAWC